MSGSEVKSFKVMVEAKGLAGYERGDVFLGQLAFFVDRINFGRKLKDTVLCGPYTRFVFNVLLVVTILL